MKKVTSLGIALLIGMGFTTTVYANSDTSGVEKPNQCIDAGPQAPRDIDSAYGTNPTIFREANLTDKMNLCNVHYHRNAEHKGGEFTTFVNTTSAGDPEGLHSGWACREPEFGEDERPDAITAMPGDTVEVHWVYTSCNVDYEALNPHDGLGACMTATCANPQLRVIAQVFEVAEHGGYENMGAPEMHDDPTVVYTGSTTGTGYDNGNHCSPFQVTWDIKTTCGEISEHALHEWGNEVLELTDENGNTIEVERHEHAHGVRTLVTDPAMLSQMKRSRTHGERD